MAATGYTPISLYYSTTTSAVPVNTNLVNGELAINITDGKLYYKDNGGTVQLIASKDAASSSVIGPASATDNAVVRFDGTTGKLVQNSAVTIADTTGDITAGAYNKVTITAPATSATLTIANGKTVTVNNTITFAGTDSTTMTFPATSQTIVGLDSTQTLTNKTITQRVSSTASISSPLAWNSDNFDMYAATAQAGNFTISADAGTPTDGRRAIFRIASDATPRVVTFTGGASKAFKPVGVTLTTSGSDFTYTLTASKITYFGCIYNTNSARWEIVALSQEA